MDLDFLEQLAEEERQFKRFSVAGTDRVQVAGNLKSGFAVNIGPKGGGGEPVPGACCFCDGTCTEETLGQCLLDGGNWQGGTCDPNPCSAKGACCDGDGNCTITTEADCSGTYLGDCTTCDPNPCGAGGVCCICGACSSLSESDCIAGGGTFFPAPITCGATNPCDPTCCSQSPFEDGLGGFWTTFYTDCDGVAHYSGATTAGANYRTLTQTYGAKCDPGCVETGTVFICSDTPYWNGSDCQSFPGSLDDCNWVCVNAVVSQLSDLCNCPESIANNSPTRGFLPPP
jgi:hypothetical protein